MLEPGIHKNPRFPPLSWGFMKTPGFRPSLVSALIGNPREAPFSFHTKRFKVYLK
jgi:hypothetical protein